MKVSSEAEERIAEAMSEDVDDPFDTILKVLVDMQEEGTLFWASETEMGAVATKKMDTYGLSDKDKEADAAYLLGFMDGTKVTIMKEE